MEPVGSNYKSKKKREYRRRKRKQTEMEPAKLNDMEFIAETSISNSPDPHQTIADKNEEKNLSASQEQHFHLIGNLEQPVNKDYDEISSQCSSSISELGAELDAAGLWRPEDDQEIAYSLPSSGRCKEKTCKETKQKCDDEIGRLGELLRFEKRQNKKLKNINNAQEIRINYAVGLQSRELLETVDKAINFRGYNLLSMATLDSRVQSNIALLQQGASLISEEELQIGMLICGGPNANIYEAIFKNMACAVKAYKGAPFSAVLKEYQILMLLSSHSSIPHAYGVVNGLTPKLVMSSYKGTHVRLPNFIFDSREELGRFAVSFMEAVAYLQERNILHNNINPSNILIERRSGKIALCGFSNASYGDDGYKVNGVRMLNRFGNLCCLPNEVKAGKNPLSTGSDLFCMGYTMMWHIRVDDDAVSDVSQFVRRFSQECVCNPEKQRPSLKRLQKFIEKLTDILA